MFSKTCQYGIRASIFIACESLRDNRVSLEKVSQKILSPEAFTAKILQKLVKHHIIRSVKGPGGGFEADIAKIHIISLRDIVEALDGDFLTQCSLGLNECSDRFPCPFHYLYKPVKENLTRLLRETTLQELAGSFDEGETFLKLYENK